MISTQDAIACGRSMLGTPYGSGAGQLDCINFIKAIIRRAPGGVPGYTTAHTNALWESYDKAAKYRDLTWRQESIEGAKAGMLAFKRSGTNVKHVGLVTGPNTVLHSSSALGNVVETNLRNGQWNLLAIHRYISVDGSGQPGNGGDDDAANTEAIYTATVTTQTDPLDVRSWPITGRIIGKLKKGTRVDVLNEGEDGWPFVRFGELEGYASGAYLRRDEQSEDHDGPTATWGLFVPCSTEEAAQALLSEIGYGVVCQKELYD